MVLDFMVAELVEATIEATIDSVLFLSILIANFAMVNR